MPPFFFATMAVSPSTKSGFFVSELLKLRHYQAVAAFELEARGPGIYREPLWAEGQAILSTVFVQALSPGASVSVRYVDKSLGEAFNEQMDLGGHETITEALSSNKTLITRFHNQPTVVAEVTGGSATFGVFVSMVDATADSDFGFGRTLTFCDVAGTSNVLLPPSPGPKVQGLSIRCSIDQPNTKRLLFSIDGGQKFIRLAPGEAFSLAPRGDLKQIIVKSLSDQTAYEVVLNTSS